MTAPRETAGAGGTQAGAPLRTALLVSADDELAPELMATLTAVGLQSGQISTGAEARRALMHSLPDLAVIDLTLPDMDGLVLLGEIKSTVPTLPTIALGGPRRRYDVVLALRLGADDVLAKPIDILEFRARVDAVITRTSRFTQPAPAAPQRPDYYQVDDLVVNWAEVRVFLGGTEVQLTPIEFRILLALVSRPDQLISRRDLVEEVWGPRDARDSRSLDVHIGRLRRKLRAVRNDAPVITPVRLQAYRLVTGDSGFPVSERLDEPPGGS